MSEINILANKETKEYYTKLTADIDAAVAIAKNARSQGKDLFNDIESVPAKGIAEKTELLVGPPGVAKVYNELWEKHQKRFPVMLEIFNMILDKELGNIEDPEKRLDQAIRTALIIETDGVVVSPLDGLPEIKLSKNPDDTEFIDIYYAGPIRAAGGNAQTLPLLLGDLARKKLGIDRYKPSKKEVERVIEEAMLYQDEVVARQQRVTDAEVRIMVENCPVRMNSFADNEVEVVANRDVPGIETNRVRGAMCLVLIDGLYVRALKIMKTSKKMGLDWSWLEKLVKVKKTAEGFELKPSTKYLEGLAAGRPVFAYPFREGGFRLRYGKARNTGLMAKAINPATMYVLDEFVAVGTHGRIERPGKSLQFFPCSTIDGPIVLLKNKSVVQIDDAETAKKYVEEIDKILFVGDMLVAVGDFRKAGHPLIKAGYVEEEWVSEINYLYRNEKINKQTLEVCKKFQNNPDPFTAVAISLRFGLPLYPKYIFYYDLLNHEELKTLIRCVRDADKIFSDEIEEENEDKKKQNIFENIKELFEKTIGTEITKKETQIIGLKIEYNSEIKRILEKIGLPHKYLEEENKILIEKEQAYPFLKTVGAMNAIDPLEEFKEEIDDKNKTSTEILSKISKLDIREKSGFWIGARMGRPEAAHEREMAGKPNVLFPIGRGFGNSRDLIKATRKRANGENTRDFGVNDVEIKAYICQGCKKIMFKNYCFECKCSTQEIRECVNCKTQTFEKICDKCNSETKVKIEHKINIDKLIEQAANNLRVGIPESIKGVKGLISKEKNAEPLEKGILRAKHDVYIFRDGTCRYEALNATISQVSAKELGITLEKIRELGYKKDYLGNDLKEENQRVSIFPQDIIVDERCGEYFLRVAAFIDDELEKFYNLPRYYDAKTKEDLIGQFVIGLAPHTSAGIIGRIIGYSKSKLAWGHPYYITAKRRNVDGDQDSMLLLMDGLLNFSSAYLGAGRGGRMDAPLAFTTVLSPFEIDDESHEIETNTEYPYEFYMASKNFAEPDKIPEVVNAGKLLGTEEQYNCIKFTHDTNCFDEGPKQSAYITIKTMSDKVQKQAKLQERIVAVDNKDSLERLLHYHLFPDFIGNTRAFARQKLRCVKCNKKYRRMPLSGICDCGGKLILTIAQGSIKKYVDVAKNLVIEYDLNPHLLQRIKLSEEEIDSLFSDKEAGMQKSLSDFF